MARKPPGRLLNGSIASFGVGQTERRSSSQRMQRRPGGETKAARQVREWPRNGWAGARASGVMRKVNRQARRPSCGRERVRRRDKKADGLGMLWLHDIASGVRVCVCVLCSVWGVRHLDRAGLLIRQRERLAHRWVRGVAVEHGSQIAHRM